MREGIFRKMDFRAAHLHDLVVLGSLARNDEVARYVREKHQLCLKFLVCDISLCEELG